MKYARVFLENCPSDTTKVFIDYYTGKYAPKQELVPIDLPITNEGGYVQNAAQFSANAVQNLTSLMPLPFMHKESISTPSAHGKQPATDGSAEDAAEPEDAAIMAALPTYTPPKPRTAFSSFVDHPDYFIVFLEACLDEHGLTQGDKADLYTTLFEMYLHKANSDDGSERAEWEAKAKKLIEGKDIPIDTSNVLLLSHLSSFKDGSILVREQAGLRFDIFRSYTTAKDTRGAIKALRKYGPDEPALYPAALAYFTSSPQILKEAGTELDAVLKKIDEDGLMAPLQVIQTLSSTGVANMGLIKPFLTRTIAAERAEIEDNRRLIGSYREQTEAKRKEIEELATKPAVFQATRCASCGGNLDLPMVHFLCKHSYHQRCLNVVRGDDGEERWECPQCKGGNETIRAIRRAQVETSTNHDLFKAALESSRDRFGTVSEFFGRGVLSVPRHD